jgi:hypothetical protein
MPASVSWYELGSIIECTVSDPLTLEELECAAEEIWALAAACRQPVDMIFDYRNVETFPRGGLPVVRDGHFTLPMLDRVALVGNEPLVEMMITTITRATFRPDPTIHTDVEEAAQHLRLLAAQDGNR